MQFSTMNLDKAVLRIFRKLCVAPESGLRQAMLVKEWTAMSLRRRDLDNTLRRMSALCYLRQEKTPEGDLLYLTPVGHEYSQQLFEHPLHNLALRLRLQWNALTRGAQLAPVDRPAPRRRIADRVTPSLG